MVTLPHPFSTLPREDLMYPHPSPISPLRRLSASLSHPATKSSDESGSSVRPSNSPNFWIKREDSNSGLALGGNKIRKLEYVLPDALAQRATILVTTGGLQSNHMRQVAAVAARYGLKTHLVPRDSVDSSDQEYKHLGNIQITHLLGASHSVPDSTPEGVLAELKSNGEVPYWIPSGASTHPLGGLGFARFAFEIAEQEKELGIFFDTIIVPSGGGSTLGGIVAGFKLLESGLKDRQNIKKRNLIGVAVYPSSGQLTTSVLQIVRSTAVKIGLLESAINESEFIIDERWSAGKYGRTDETTQEAIKMLAQKEGILTDPVYTGKALACLIGKARLGEYEGGENVLFVHTGGVAALSAYPNVR